MGSRSEAAKKAWFAIRASRLKLGALRKKSPAILKASVPAPSKASEAAKKAWVTRRKNVAENDPVQAEEERQAALRILDELAKNRLPQGD